MTAIDDGRLQLTGSLAGGAVLVGFGATLSGTGVIGGPVTVTGGLEPGGLGTTGTLTINNTLTLLGDTIMEVNKTGAVLTGDQVAGLTGAIFGGTLTVTPTGDPLAEGDTFQIFSKVSGAFTGGFISISPATLGANLRWGTAKLLSEGKLVVESVPAPFNVALDPLTDTGLFDNDGVTILNDVRIIGQAEADAIVSIYEGAALLTSGTALGGNFTIPLSLAVGTHDLRLTATDAGGNVSLTSTPLTVIVDQSVPSAPTAALAAADDTGLFNNDGITYLSTGLTITGTCETTAVVVVFDGGTSLASGLILSNTYALDVDLAEGSHALTVQQTDAAGNVSPDAMLNITVDQTAPAVSVTSPWNGAQVAGIAVTTVTFNEAVGNVTADKLTITSASETANATSVTAMTGATYVFGINDNYGIGPTVLLFELHPTSGSSTLTDVAGNPVIPTSWTLTKDGRLVPVTIASALTPDGSWTSQTSIVFTAQFDEAMAGFDPAAEPDDLLLVNCVLTTGSGSGSGASYAFAVTPLAVGPVEVSIPSGICGAIAVPAGRPNADSNIWRFTADNVLPFFTNLVAAPTPANQGTTVTLTFTASESLFPGTRPDVTVNGHAAIYKSLAGLNYTYEYAIQSSDAEGTATISMMGFDLAYNSGTTVDATALFVDKIAPTAIIIPAEPDPLPQTIEIIFSEPVTGMDPSYLTLTCNAVTVAFSGFTPVTPSLYTVIIPNNKPGTWVMTLSATSTAIRDYAGNNMQVGATATWRVTPESSDVVLWSRY
ncbi:MAG: Ig-like domain-containing protein [Candidatus Sumerlaeota bacterium]|nr:Ig-like domain-containing protein [Candidatus Sumerlaeota bacterium]